MRFLFVSAQLPGHLDWGGYLATAAELVRRGREVRWASGEEVAPLVAQAGVPFHPLRETGWRWPPPPPLQLSPDLDAVTVRRLRAERALDQWLDVARVTPAAAQLIALGQSFRPDLVVSEVFASAAGIAAERLGVPLVVAGWPALQPKTASGDDDLVAEARSRLHRLLTHFALQGENWTAEGAPALLSPHLHLTYWSPGWYRGLALLPQTVHVGGQAPAPASPPPWPDLDPWVLITLGTSFSNDPNFFINAAHAAVQLGCLPILVLGGQLPAAALETMRGRLPAQKIVTERVDFAAVLPNVAAAIHHGGAGTTHALLTHAVPQIIVPHAADQMHQAQGVVRSGVGVHVPAREATIDRLAAVLAQVLPDLSPYRAKTQALRDEFARLGGVQRAAELLEQAPSYPPRSTG
jgi:UDP-N-acetylglucosamine:LPS N-acetylglucosamine transferase